MTTRRNMYELLEPSASGRKDARLIELFLIVLIFANILVVILESVKTINAQYRSTFIIIEYFSVFVFTIEYFLRIWCCVENPEWAKKGRTRYATTPMAVIDLLSILPFYVHLLPVDFLFLRILRLFRLFRLLKIARYLKALNIIQAVVRERREQIVLSLIFILFLLVIISTVMFYVEHEAQPAIFTSIPATMWYAISTLTTVGYGDMVPVTPLGKLLGGVIAILGIGVIALPAGILSSGLTDHLHGRNKKERKCPHCGGELVD